MTRSSNPFAPPAPASGLVRGSLAALATAGAVVLAAAGFCALVAGTYRLAQVSASPWPTTWSAPASAPSCLPDARRVWGEIRARYRLKHLQVPA